MGKKLNKYKSPRKHRMNTCYTPNNAKFSEWSLLKMCVDKEIRQKSMQYVVNKFQF